MVREEGLLGEDRIGVERRRVACPRVLWEVLPPVVLEEGQPRAGLWAGGLLADLPEGLEGVLLGVQLLVDLLPGVLEVVRLVACLEEVLRAVRRAFPVEQLLAGLWEDPKEEDLVVDLHLVVPMEEQRLNGTELNREKDRSQLKYGTTHRDVDVYSPGGPLGGPPGGGPRPGPPGGAIPPPK